MPTTLKQTEPSTGQYEGGTDELALVGSHWIDVLWPRVVHFMDSAAVRGNMQYPPLHIRDQLKRGDALLWIAYKGSEIFGAMTVEHAVMTGTNMKVLVVTSLGATSFKRCKAFMEQIHQYARDQGCKKIRLYGRHGWIRALRDDGYMQPWIALEKVL